MRIITPGSLRARVKNRLSRQGQPAWAAIVFSMLLISFFLPFNTHAGAGHDHDNNPNDNHGTHALDFRPSPRFVLSSQAFEAVGVLKGTTIEIHVDHAPTNAPLDVATVELELNGNRVPVERHAVGEFDAALPANLINVAVESPIAVALTIAAEGQVEHLAGELSLPHEHIHPEEDHATHSHVFEWSEWSGWFLYGVGFLILLCVAGLGMRWANLRQGGRGQP